MRTLSEKEIKMVVGGAPEGLQEPEGSNWRDELQDMIGDYQPEPEKQY